MKTKPKKPKGQTHYLPNEAQIEFIKLDLARLNVYEKLEVAMWLTDALERQALEEFGTVGNS